VDKDRHMRYVFNGKDNLIELLQSPDETIIWDEYDVPYTVASMISEIRKYGVIVLENGR